MNWSRPLLVIIDSKIILTVRVPGKDGAKARGKEDDFISP